MREQIAKEGGVVGEQGVEVKRALCRDQLSEPDLGRRELGPFGDRVSVFWVRLGIADSLENHAAEHMAVTGSCAPRLARSSPMNDFGGLSFEQANITRAARITTSFVLIWMVLGISLGFILRMPALQGLALVSSIAVVVVAYPVMAKRSQGRVARGVWVNVALILVVGFVMSMYSALKIPLEGVHSVESHWDQYIPTVPVFVFPYLGTYVMIVVTGAFFATRMLHRQLRTYLLSSALAILLTDAIFILFQTQIDTETLTEASYNTDLFGPILQYVVLDLFKDNFYGDFPSMHCAFATTIALTWIRRGNRTWSILIIIFALSVYTATQVLHVHYLMDMVWGIVNATAMFGVAWFLLEYRPALNRFRRTALAHQSVSAGNLPDGGFA